MAVFCVPLVLSKSAAAPTAVLESALLRASAPPPTPVLKLPVVSKKRERQPSAVFPAPVVRRLSASHPSAVVKFGKHPSATAGGVAVGIGVDEGVGVGMGVGDGVVLATVTIPTIPQQAPCGVQEYGKLPVLLKV